MTASIRQSTTLGLLILTLGFLLTTASPTLAQHEPAVMLRTRLPCPGPQCRTATIGQGNGVLIGRNRDQLLVLTVAHNIRDALSIEVQLDGRWHSAKTAHADLDADIAVLTVQGDFEFPIAKLAEQDPQAGAEVLLDGYWPNPWTRRVVRTQRIRTASHRFYFLQTRVVPGVSGAGVVFAGKLAGLVHGVTLEGERSVTLIVPISIIQQRLKTWGYRISKANRDCAQPQVEPEPSTAENCACDCETRLAELQQSFLTLSQRIDTLSDKSSNEQNWQVQIDELKQTLESTQEDLAELQPLLERRVVLLSDGQVAAERRLKPEDPLVLGSEIVVRKAAAE
ncbi:S1 family peptidase [Rubinisphaera brasiliensis]|uniref:Peptidase S1 and S6 chymotrypsin/Hap n=1 Tax=Rubinisphaera brasiliensis (strain ATCC 49424 / DSM 5305 / JCM 21570 / IAM 15109 / NBRC 103401 / IFAM 1448) TaxID=756272 RepID=F0SNP3_RUBBR|nr:serine protease [Rubinisphaera brasiliensis]ADY58929.1 hypothetical protein Plabr_1317 [Rubinisphaera brasiliensis DSM 5305]